MTRKQRRALFIGVGVAILSVAVLLVLIALRDTIVFFHTPSEVAQKGIGPGKRIRLGGLVAIGSLKRGAGSTVEFAVTDTASSIEVRMAVTMRSSTGRRGVKSGGWLPAARGR